MPEKRRKDTKSTVIMAVITFGLTALFCCAGWLVKTAAENPPEIDSIETGSVFSDVKNTQKLPEITDFGDYEEISKFLSELKATDEVWTEMDSDPTKTGFYCIRTENLGPSMIYTLDPENICGHTMREYNYFWVDSVNTAFYAVVNIPGETVDLSDYYVLVHDDSGNLASRLIVNCYGAKTVKLDNAIFAGTLLAPNATVEYNNTTVYGAVYAKNTTGERAFYSEIPFSNYELLMSGGGEPVTFSNFNMPGLVMDNLRREYPEIYNSYSDTFVLTNADTARLKTFNADGAMIEKFYGDLDTMVNLETLSVKGTKLTSLDVSGLKNLRVLNVSDTNISEIVFGSDSKLEELNLSGTGITGSVDFSKLPALKKLVLQDTGISAFTTEQLLFLGPQLTELDVSDNRDLTKFDASQFPKLISLSVAETKITQLDVSSCIELETLNVNYTEMKELDVSANKKLKKITAYGPYTKITVASDTVTVGKLENTAVEIKNN